MKVVGVDLSLASTGLAWSETLDAGRVRPQVARIESRPTTPDLPARSVRLRRIVARAWQVCSDADLVVMESPTYSANVTGSSHDRAGLWWLLAGRITGAGIPLVEVSPPTLKVYALGTGRGGKDQVLAAVIRRYAEVRVGGNDEADALVLCCMGLRHLGHPYDQLSDRHTRAMAAVAWPPHMKGATHG